MAGSLLNLERAEEQLAGSGVVYFRHVKHIKISMKHLHSWFEDLSLKAIIQGPSPCDTFCSFNQCLLLVQKHLLLKEGEKEEI